jgi:HD-GYP domain-containing protein (c-di-GMP phosphodiesterase class II)
MALRERSHWQLLPAWKWDIIAHGYRLVWPAQATANILEMSAEQISRVGLAALLHDLGKLALPSKILLKPDPLSTEEWVVIHRHPEIGAQMLSLAGGAFAELSRIVVAHHERWDGGGYPSGLARDVIPLEARILSVADAFDAMTLPRVYRQSLTCEEARTELKRCSGQQFDPLVVQAFLQMLDGWKQLLARWVLVPMYRNDCHKWAGSQIVGL